MLVAYGALAPHHPGDLLAGLFHPRFIYQLDNCYRQQMHGGVSLGWAFPPPFWYEFSGVSSGEVHDRFLGRIHVFAVEVQVYYFHPLRMKGTFQAEFILHFDSFQGIRFVQGIRESWVVSLIGQHGLIFAAE